MPTYRLADLKLIALQIDCISPHKESVINLYPLYCNFILNWNIPSFDVLDNFLLHMVIC